MIDKAEAEFEKVRKRHSKHIKIATINFDKNMMLKNVDIQLKPTIHVYVADFRKKSNEVQIDVGNAFQVSRADILNGSFANSFDGFYAYSGARGKLGLLMGLGYLFGSDIEMITPKFLGNIKTEGMNISTIGNAVEKDLPEIYEQKQTAGRKTDTSPRQGGAGMGAAKSKKILSVSQFDTFAKSKGFNAKFADTEKFVSFMFKYSKDLFGRSSLKGMSWNAIYNLNPKSVDWISWSKIDTDDFLEYVKQYSRKRK
jgi:hypothetical protein